MFQLLSGYHWAIKYIKLQLQVYTCVGGLGSQLLGVTPYVSVSNIKMLQCTFQYKLLKKTNEVYGMGCHSKIVSMLLGCSLLVSVPEIVWFCYLLLSSPGNAAC